MKASATSLPVRARASTSAAASSAVNAMGFSHSTCLPASIALIVQGTWRWFGSGL